MAEPERLGPYAEFGKWMRECREAAHIKSQPEAVLRAKPKKLRLITQGKLSHLERGMNGNPAPELLAELAQLYSLNYDEVVARWMQLRYRVANDLVSDLSRHGRTGQQTPHHKGESDVPASDREELERLVKDYESRLGEVHDVASRLIKLTAFGSKENRAAARLARQSGKRDRKTG